MSEGRYKVGTKLMFLDPQSGESFKGEVIPNAKAKLPSDVGVIWETGLLSSYNEAWLDRFTTVLEKEEN